MVHRVKRPNIYIDVTQDTGFKVSSSRWGTKKISDCRFGGHIKLSSAVTLYQNRCRPNNCSGNKDVQRPRKTEPTEQMDKFIVRHRDDHC